MVDQIMELPEGTKIQLLAPVVRGRKGRHEKLLEKAKKSGYVRVRIDGNLYELSEEISLDKNIKHNIEIIVDRLVVREGIQKRLTDSIESVLALAEEEVLKRALKESDNLSAEALFRQLGQMNGKHTSHISFGDVCGFRCI